MDLSYQSPQPRTSRTTRKTALRIHTNRGAVPHFDESIALTLLHPGAPASQPTDSQGRKHFFSHPRSQFVASVSSWRTWCVCIAVLGHTRTASTSKQIEFRCCSTGQTQIVWCSKVICAKIRREFFPTFGRSNGEHRFSVQFDSVHLFGCLRL